MLSIHDSSPAKINTQPRGIKFGGLQNLSGENIKIDNSNKFRRHTGAIKLKDLREQNPEVKTLPLEKRPNQKLEELKFKKLKNMDESMSKANTFRKSSKVSKHQQQIKQYEGELPAELIVTGYHKSKKATTIEGTVPLNSEISFRKKPSVKLMNFVGQTPKKEIKGIQQDQTKQERIPIYEYPMDPMDLSRDDKDFFKTTTSREFDEYMQQH